MWFRVSDFNHRAHYALWGCEDSKAFPYLWAKERVDCGTSDVEGEIRQPNVREYVSKAQERMV